MVNYFSSFLRKGCNFESNGFQKDVHTTQKNKTIRRRMASLEIEKSRCSFDVTLLDYEMMHVLAEVSSAGGLTPAAATAPF